MQYPAQYNIHLIRFVQQFMKLKFFIYHIWYVLYMYLITKPYQIYIRVSGSGCALGKDTESHTARAE